MRLPRPDSRQGGFTLIEMVVVMTITGLLVAIVAVFIQRPMQGLIDSVGRAALADAADTAVRRLQRDLQAALPNSVRLQQSGGVWYLEFLPVLGAGRYCSEADCGAHPLDTRSAQSQLSFVGPALPAAVGTGNELVIYNLGVAGADAWAGDNVATLASHGSGLLGFAAHRFPFASPGQRFHIVGGPVSYVCGNSELRRISGYARQPGQPLATPAGAASALLADGVASCQFEYLGNAIDQNGLLVLTLGLTRNQESVTLTHAIRILNQP